MVRSALVGILFCVAVAPQAAHAQGIAKSFDELRLLVRPGDTVTVTDTKSGADIKGKVFTLSASSLILTVDNSQKEWREGDVSVIHQRRGDPLGNGALWGFGIGGILGAIVGASFAEDGGEAVAGALIIGALYGGLGAGIGVGVDALVTSAVVIYEKPVAGRVALGFAPVATRRSAGAALVVRF